MPRLRLDDVQLYYEEYGTGDNVVLSAQMELAQGDSYQQLLSQAGFTVYYLPTRASSGAVEQSTLPWAPQCRC